MNVKGKTTEILPLRNVFNDPTSIYRSGAFNELLYGFTAEPTEKFDEFFTQEVFDLILISIIRNQLFFLDNKSFVSSKKPAVRNGFNRIECTER
jgi:hypothetical protein